MWFSTFWPSKFASSVYPWSPCGARHSSSVSITFAHFYQTLNQLLIYSRQTLHLTAVEVGTPSTMGSVTDTVQLIYEDRAAQLFNNDAADSHCRCSATAACLFAPLYPLLSPRTAHTFFPGLCHLTQRWARHEKLTASHRGLFSS